MHKKLLQNLVIMAKGDKYLKIYIDKLHNMRL